MNDRKAILRFLGRAAIVFALMSAAWPLVRPAYRAGFCFVGELVFGSLGQSHIRLENVNAPQGRMDVRALIRNASNGAKGEIEVSSRDLGYTPTIVLVSLTLALPLRWRRRGRALIAGLALVNLYVLLRLGFFLLAFLGGDSAIATFSLGRAADSAMDFIAELLSISLAGCYLGPIIIWIAVAVRLDDGRLADRPSTGGRL